MSSSSSFLKITVCGESNQSDSPYARAHSLWSCHSRDGGLMISDEYRSSLFAQSINFNRYPPPPPTSPLATRLISSFIKPFNLEHLAKSSHADRDIHQLSAASQQRQRCSPPSMMNQTTESPLLPGEYLLFSDSKFLSEPLFTGMSAWSSVNNSPHTIDHQPTTRQAKRVRSKAIEAPLDDPRDA